jgi:hypothetical protein
MRWTDATGKTWERPGSGPWISGRMESGANVELGALIRVS